MMRSLIMISLIILLSRILSDHLALRETKVKTPKSQCQKIFCKRIFGTKRRDVGGLFLAVTVAEFVYDRPQFFVKDSP